MRFLLILLVCIWGTGFTCYAQEVAPDPEATPHKRTCGTNAFLDALQADNPAGYQQQQLAKVAVEQSLKAQATKALRAAQAKITIPVVFHVVYNKAAENISDEQVYSQLAILNADFRRLNADTANTPAYFRQFTGDAGIEFCLASVDPEGNPTNGITRTKTTRTSFDNTSANINFASLGGADIWDRNNYLNIWICNISGGILGYATPPGTPASLDGVVLLYSSIGAPPYNTFSSPYNQGRTATHEVGHWLGLQHIWGTRSQPSCYDSDDIDDTPNQYESTGGCPGKVISSCDNGPYGNMWQNYMDYSDDNCMNLFTQGQIAYMRTVLATTRASILTSPVCSSSIQADFEVANPQDTLVMAGNTVSFADLSVGSRPTSWLWEFEGASTTSSTEQNPAVTYQQPGTYKVTLTVKNGPLSDTKTKELYVQVTVNDLMVYPNPASDYVQIEQPARIEVRQVELVNQLGQILRTQQLQERTVRLPVYDLPSGVYFLRIKSSNGIKIKKIVVTR